MATFTTTQQQNQQTSNNMAPPFSSVNSQYYYNHYGLSPNQPPPHPDRSVQVGGLQGSYQAYSPSAAATPNNNVGFSSPPPPTMQDILLEFGPTPTEPSFQQQQQQQPTDFLDGSTVPAYNTGVTSPSSHTGPPTAIRVPTQSDSRPQRDPSPLSTTTLDLPADIIASQERAMAEAKRRQYEHWATNNTSTTATTEITEYDGDNKNMVMIEVPVSRNPVGSDAVHPDRQYWKQSRGGKTVVGAAGGAIIGGLIMAPVFPVGMVLGGAAGGYAANKISKTGERRAQRKWEQSSFQNGIIHSKAVEAQSAIV